MRPQLSPRPNLDVETGYVASRAPFPISMSFWSRTLIMTRLGPSARIAGNSDVNAMRISERRNIMEFLLRIENLSRGNCNFGPPGTEVDFWKPLTDRGERDVEETCLEHGEKWQGDELPVLNCEPNKVRKIEGESHLRDREKRLEGHVLAVAPGLRLPFDTVFRRAGKIRFVIENSFENGPRIIK